MAKWSVVEWGHSVYFDIIWLQERKEDEVNFKVDFEADFISVDSTYVDKHNTKYLTDVHRSIDPNL